jgi:hypothetical protein
LSWKITCRIFLVGQIRLWWWALEHNPCKFSVVSLHKPRITGNYYTKTLVLSFSHTSKSNRKAHSRNITNFESQW